jgi:branched-chain amino acid aminotransferase
MVDGALVTSGSAAISPFDRGLLFGEGAFETMRTYGVSIFALDEHLARLARSLTAIGVALPCPEATLADEARRARDAFGADDAIVRVVVTAGDDAPARIVLVEPLVVPPEDRYVGGFSVTLRRGPSLAVPGAKTTSYVANLLARREAASAGADEALLLDEDGDVVEGATSNVLAVLDGVVVTPPTSRGALPGITLRHALLLAAQAGLMVREQRLPASTLPLVSELMLTSTLREVAPVTRVDGRPVGTGSPGPIATELRRSFRAARS